MELCGLPHSLVELVQLKNEFVRIWQALLNEPYFFRRVFYFTAMLPIVWVGGPKAMPVPLVAGDYRLQFPVLLGEAVVTSHFSLQQFLAMHQLPGEAPSVKQVSLVAKDVPLVSAAAARE